MIDLTAAKAWLRVVTADEDSVIQVSLNAALGAIQKRTGKLFTAAPLVQQMPGFPRRGLGHDCADVLLGYGGFGYGDVDPLPIRLFSGPVDATTADVSIKYDDVNGVEQTLSDFRLVDGSNALILPAYGSQWPQAQCQPGSVRVTYTAGYPANGVPPELDQAVLYLVGHYYENRSAVQAGLRAAAVKLPETIEELIADYCPPGLA